MGLLTPKFVTKEIAKRAVNVALKGMGADHCLANHLIRGHYHIVVLVPATEDAREEDYTAWPNYPTQPYPIYQESAGRNSWEREYDDIARCKALQLWTGRNDGGTSVSAHLLFSGDTPYYGGAKRDGIVVTCSGFKSWIDRLLSNIVADTIITLAHDALENDTDVAQKASFLS